MPADYAIRINKHFRQQARQQQRPTVVTGTVQRLQPLMVTCYDGAWSLAGTALGKCQHVGELAVGDNVLLAGTGPYYIVGVI